MPALSRLRTLLATSALLATACGPRAVDDAPIACTDAEACPAGQVCSVDAVCVPTGTCADDADCGGPEYCADELCVPRPACTADDAPACPVGTYCSAGGACIADGTCATHADCGADACSVTGVCLAPNTCLASADCDEVHVCVDQACVLGSDCFDFDLPIEVVQPDLLVALDRSCSMRDPVTMGGPSKWQLATDALIAMTATYDASLRFGLALFPDGDGAACSQAAPAVEVGDATAAAIAALLDAAQHTGDVNYPDGPCVTNIDTAMAQVAAAPALADPTRPHYAMLITDGKQANCELGGGDAGTTSTIDLLATAGVPTFVVGFGDAVDAAALRRWALVGGTALPVAPAYYQADDAAELSAALAAIAAAATPCTFAVPTAPADLALDQLHVFVDGATELPRDDAHADGWSYDVPGRTLTLWGDACAAVQGGGVTSLAVVYACPVID